MNQEALNSLKPGEKVADIQEYYWGKNGFRLVFKVTVYTCVHKHIFGIFKKHIVDTYEFPFYFVSKELAEMYLKDYDNYKVVPKYYDNITSYRYETLALVPKNIENCHNTYYMTDAYGTLSCPCSKSVRLVKNGIWGGMVNTELLGKYVNIDNNFAYNKIYEYEKCAAKEGTTGKTYSYKLETINE